jgi:intracellular sulfur oxidation DsrE/DsrF family protein
MDKHDLQQATNRRSFLGSLATGAAAMGVAGLAAPLSLQAKEPKPPVDDPADPEAWFNNVKGKHKVVFDATEAKDLLPFAWPKVFLMTNGATGTPEKDCSVVVVLRHGAIPFAMESRLWEKYKFGEVFKYTDGATKAPAIRNPYWMPKPGDFKIPGLGQVAIGINELQDSGVMFCVCDVAMTVYSAAIAGGMGLNAEDVKKDFVSGLLPKIQVMPSGVWAVTRAQEHGCTYVFAG